ncbi:MAG TPA: chromosome segregation protein SMC [Patescibacteria group bacterium]|nr:chromosome segregation protein SMC [Patescibacteria group bacterium]
MQQRDLFLKPGFTIVPDVARDQPALWIRRLVIWREPGFVIQDVSLKPGLNIVWSPESGGTGEATIGHGSGKTTFCRLLRYCLGEENYATDGQRQRVLEKLPKGHVGAEVVVNGRIWAVVRALSDRRRDIVTEGGTLDDAFQENAVPTGMRPLRDVITRAVIGAATSLIPGAEGAAWGAALAWVTRDQECRFGHHLEWRHPDTASRSPVGRSVDDRLVIVRSLIGALSTDEIAVRRTEEADDAKQRDLKTELERLDWQIKRTRVALLAIFGENAGHAAGTGLDATAFKTTAAERLARTLKLPDEVKSTDIKRTRGDRDKAKRELDVLEAERKGIGIRIEEKNKVLAMLRAELPEAHAEYVTAKVPICRICKVPIDTVRAEGCGISLTPCDIEALQSNIRQVEQTIEREDNEIKALERDKPTLDAKIAIVRQRYDRLEGGVATLEKAQSTRSKAVRDAQRLVDDAERYGKLVSERAEATKKHSEAATGLVKVRETLAAYRTASAETIRTLSEKFDAVLRELVPGEIGGEVKLDGNGLTLRVQMGGERSTAAIESLKVIAFDLAALVMTIEGRTRLPGLLVHDSPREADLGRSIYHRLFSFAGMLEKLGAAPLFQYIVTTTTEPPEEFKSKPWLSLVICGAPAEERLLKVDL